MTNLLTNGGDYYIATIKGTVVSGRIVSDGRACGLSNNAGIGTFMPLSNYGYRYQQPVLTGSLSDLVTAKVRRLFIIKADGSISVVEGFSVGSVIECQRLDTIMTVIFTSGELVICKVGKKATRNFTRLELEDLGFVNAIPKFSEAEQACYDKILSKTSPVKVSIAAMAKSLGVKPEDIQLTE